MEAGKTVPRPSQCFLSVTGLIKSRAVVLPFMGFGGNEASAFINCKTEQGIREVLNLTKRMGFRLSCVLMLSVNLC